MMKENELANVKSTAGAVKMGRLPCRDCKKECYGACGRLIGWRNEPPHVYLRDKEQERQQWGRG